MSGLAVVHVVCTDAFAGAERYVLGSALGLAALGCRVTVVGGAEESMREPLERAGVRWLPGGSMAVARRSLRGIPRPDVINTHMTIADVVGVRVGRRRNVPVVSTRHFASTRGSSFAARLVARWVARRIAGQIAISEFVAASIEGESTVVYTGVADVDTVIAGRTDTVLVAQRQEAEKATDVALRAWALVADRGSWRMQLAGSGAEHDSLVELADSLGITASVEFLGFQSDVDALFRSAAILLAPTPREGLGLSVIESMSFGLPVVASAAGGHLESAGGAEGAALFPPGDAAAAAAQLARLMGDPAERERYGAALRDRQRTLFNVRDQTEGTLRVLAAAAGR